VRVKVQYGSRNSLRRAVGAVVDQLEPRKLLSAYTLNTLDLFNGSNGSAPQSPLIMDANGNLFGTTASGGASQDGTVFEIRKGTTTIASIASFNGADGKTPEGALVLDSNGNLFGTTVNGGANQAGAVFEVPRGATTINLVASFGVSTGSNPIGGLTIDSDGNLFGTTSQGSVNPEGSIFEVFAGSSSITTLAAFNANGADPQATVTLDSSGDLFGTTLLGGANDNGTVFELAKNSTSITVLASFVNTISGAFPAAPVIFDSSGNLFGTATADTSQTSGEVFEIPHGTTSIHVLATFNGTNGFEPISGLTLDTSGNLYGTTASGGASNHGTVFELPSGANSIVTLADFNGANGAAPLAGVISDGHGDFLGTTSGDSINDGNVFELAPTATRLAFSTQPKPAFTNASLSPVGVHVEDASGATLIANTSTVTLTIASGPAGAILGGTISVMAVNGVAAFDNLKLNKAGTYTLRATDGSLTPATSASFTITNPPTIGGLDPTFGNNGIASHVVGMTSMSSVLVEPNNQSLIVGTVGAVPTEDFALTRYNADGSLDTSFGNNGVVATPCDADMRATASALLPNGDILVAGIATPFTNGQSHGSEFALAEYTPAGVEVAGFGDNGDVVSSFSTISGTLSNDVAHAIAVSPSGDIYVAGSSDAGGNGQQFAIAAYKPDGTLDTSFNGTGRVLLAFPGGNANIAALAVQSNGRIVAAGSASNNGVGSVALARFLPNGSLDQTFGKKGTVTMSPGGVNDGASSLAIAPATGALVVGGYTATGSATAGTLSSNFLVLRFTSAGLLDHSFNGTGIATTNFGQPAAITSVLIEADGSILASGKSTPSLSTIDLSALDFAVAKYPATGAVASSPVSFHALFDPGSVSPSSLISPNASPTEQPARLVPLAASTLMTQFNQLVTSAQGASATNTGGELLVAGNSNTATVEAAVITMGLDLAAAVIGSQPGAVVGGAKGIITVQVREAGTQLVSGVFTIQLFTAVNGSVSSIQAPFTSVRETLKLKQGQTVLFHLSFVFPTSLPNGSYSIAATVSPGTLHDINPVNNTAYSPAPTAIAQPFVDLTGSSLIAPKFVVAKLAAVAFTLTNNGNIPTPNLASTLEFFASTTGTLANAILLASQPLRPVLGAMSSRVFRTTLAIPKTLPHGNYFLIALLDPADVFNDPNLSNNLIRSGNIFTV
jgi:uncharacterized delta-60 repeat protein